MVDEIDLNSFLTSPFSADIDKQQKAFLSAKNIRKVTESVDEYNARMSAFKEAQHQKLLQENTDVMQQRLENLNITNISGKNRAAIESLINEAQSLKFFAHNNNYNTSDIDFTNLDKALAAAQFRLKNIQEKKEKSFGTGIFSDSFQTKKPEDNLLQKLLNKK